jgi:hypothetical protein
MGQRKNLSNKPIVRDLKIFLTGFVVTLFYVLILCSSSETTKILQYQETEVVLNSYQEVTREELSSNFYKCLNEFTIEIVPKISSCGDVKIPKDSVFLGCCDSYTKKIELVKSSNDQITKLVFVHELLHAVLACKDIDQSNNHEDPAFWTCKGSVEWEVSKKLGGEPINIVYSTFCFYENEPPNYDPIF